MSAGIKTRVKARKFFKNQNQINNITCEYRLQKIIILTIIIAVEKIINDSVFVESQTFAKYRFLPISTDKWPRVFMGSVTKSLVERLQQPTTVTR